MTLDAKPLNDAAFAPRDATAPDHESFNPSTSSIE
jgi:hypothetical protein